VEEIAFQVLCRLAMRHSYWIGLSGKRDGQYVVATNDRSGWHPVYCASCPDVVAWLGYQP
jgi:hypothetical protein